jgi:hypothetical protein
MPGGDLPNKCPYNICPGHLRYESKTMYFAIDFLAKTLAEGGDTDRLKPLESSAYPVY